MQATSASYGYLVLAILFEVAGTSLLKTTNGFTALGPTLLVAIGYGLSFWLLTLAMEGIPVAVAYALWSALGNVLVNLAAAYWYRQRPDAAAMVGIAMIVGGVVVLQLFSRGAAH